MVIADILWETIIRKLFFNPNEKVSSLSGPPLEIIVSRDCKLRSVFTPTVLWNLSRVSWTMFKVGKIIKNLHRWKIPDEQRRRSESYRRKVNAITAYNLYSHIQQTLEIVNKQICFIFFIDYRNVFHIMKNKTFPSHLLVGTFHVVIFTQSTQLAHQLWYSVGRNGQNRCTCTAMLILQRYYIAIQTKKEHSLNRMLDRILTWFTKTNTPSSPPAPTLSPRTPPHPTPLPPVYISDQLTFDMASIYQEVFRNIRVNNRFAW